MLLDQQPNWRWRSQGLQRRRTFNHSALPKRPNLWVKKWRKELHNENELFEHKSWQALETQNQLSNKDQKRLNTEPYYLPSIKAIFWYLVLYSLFDFLLLYCFNFDDPWKYCLLQTMEGHNSAIICIQVVNRLMYTGLHEWRI